MNLVRYKGHRLTLCFKALVLFVFLLAASLTVSVSSQPVQPSLTLVYTRPNGRIGDVSLTPSGELLFSNYPTKPGRLWCLTKGLETLAYEVSKTTYDLYGVAASRSGDVYVSCPYTGEVLRLSPSGGVFTVYIRASKNIGPLAFAPNGTLYFAELIPSEGYQSVFKLVPRGVWTGAGEMAEVLVYTAPMTVGGIAFNSRGELFFSDGPKGRLWKVVNGTPVLYVDRKSWSTMYGIVFDQYDNLYFCDWSSPGNIYYLDFRLNLAYRVLDASNSPLSRANVLVAMPNGSTAIFSTNSTGHVVFKSWPGRYDLKVFWSGVPVGSFVFNETASGKRDLTCSVFNVRLTAKDDLGRALKNSTFEIRLPNGTWVKSASPTSLSCVPAGLLSIRTLYKDVEVAEPLDINVSSNLDVSIPCKVYQLSAKLLDPDGGSLKDAWIRVSLDGLLLVNQSYPEGGVTLDGLLAGECVVSASLKGFVVAEAFFDVNTSRSVVLTANVSRLVVNARDFFGLPMQGVRVNLTLPDGSNVGGVTDVNGSFRVNWVPWGDADVVLDTGLERRTVSLRLDSGVVESSQVFNFSWVTVLALVLIVLIALIVIPPSRRLIAKAFPIEVSTGERRSIASAYLDSLSSRGLTVEEAVEVEKGEARVLAGEGKLLPLLESEADHAVFLVSDSSFIPPRREVRVLVEASVPEKDVENVSRLVKEYSERTGLRALGILVCEEVTEGLLNLLKGLRDVEVVYATRNALDV